MRTALLILTIALAACGALKPAQPGDPAARKAVALGRSSGDLSCTVALAKAPKAQPNIELALAATDKALAGDSFTIDALRAGMQSLPTKDARLFGGAFISAFESALVLADVDATGPIAKGSPVELGLAAAVAGCRDVLAGPVIG